MAANGKIEAKGGVYCRGCGYDLRGQGADALRCPECGRGFDPGVAGSFRRRPLRGAWWRWVRRVGMVVLGLSLVVGLAVGSAWGWLYWGWKTEQNTLTKLGATWQSGIEVVPVGGKPLQDRLGSAGWVLDRTTFAELPNTTSDADLMLVRKLTRLSYLNLNYTKVTDAGLVYVGELKTLRELHLDETRIGDGGLVHLKDLQGLEILGVGKTKITDAGLVHLAGIKGLRSLHLENNPGITDGCVDELRDFKGLRELYLGNTKFTDVGLGRLKEIKGLEVLDLQLLPITAAGLMKLRDVKGLRQLVLYNRKISYQEIEALEGALPGTRIVR